MIVGFRCPQGKGDLPFEECLRCGTSHSNSCSFDYPILASMYQSLRKEEGISVTSLLNCLRKIVLQVRNDVYLDPRQLYYAFRGQLFHSIIAQAQQEGAIVEQRFEREIEGILLCGHPDVIYPNQKKIVEYKSTRRVPKDEMPYANHGIQLNLYRYLVKPDFKIDQLEIVYFDMSRVLRMAIPVMDEAQLLEWLVPRLKKLKAALDSGELPEKVEGEGLWQCEGYCPFTNYCWPKGVSKLRDLRRKRDPALMPSGGWNRC